MTKRHYCAPVLAAALLAGCAGYEERELLPELDYATLACAQLVIELASETTQLDISQRLLLFEQAIPNDQSWIHENAIAQTRVNIAAILEAGHARRCES